MKIRRRGFIQQVGLLSLALGGGYLYPHPVFGATITNSAVNKLALLIGINKYITAPALKGSLTDVELQTDLLINRFGFKASNILQLTDAQATRDNIEKAFLEHLTKETKPDDIVLVHFSGYGRQVIDQDGKIINSFVLIDQDILESTFSLLIRSLNTDRITVVLDTSFYPFENQLLGDLAIRSLPQIQINSIDPREYELQNQLLTITQKTNTPGLILQAALPNQLAAEFSLNKFNAGLFTYSLTQHLWSVTSNTRIGEIVRQSSQSVARIQQKQHPELKAIQNKISLSPYYTNPITDWGAEAFVIDIDQESKSVEIKLVGLNLFVLSYLDIDSCFSLPNTDPAILRIKSKEGQIAKGHFIGEGLINDKEIYLGALLQESIRTLSRDIPLIIALDSNLDRIEKVDATSAISTLPLKVSTVAVGDLTADCLLSRQYEQNESNRASYALFTPCGQLLPFSKVSPPDDALKLAILNLLPNFKNLLALKLWRLTLNSHASKLPVRASLERKTSQGEESLIKQATRGNDILSLKLQNHGLVSISLGSFLQYRIENLSNSPLSVLLVEFDPQEGLLTTVLTKQPIKPQEIFLSSPIESSSNLGYRENYIVCTVSSLNISNTSKSNYSLDIAQSVLEALTQTKDLLYDSSISTSAAYYKLDLKHWATFGFTYQIISDAQ